MRDVPREQIGLRKCWPERREHTLQGHRLLWLVLPVPPEVSDGARSDDDVGEVSWSRRLVGEGDEDPDICALRCQQVATAAWPRLDFDGDRLGAGYVEIPGVRTSVWNISTENAADVHLDEAAVKHVAGLEEAEHDSKVEMLVDVEVARSNSGSSLTLPSASRRLILRPQVVALAWSWRASAHGACPLDCGGTCRHRVLEVGGVPTHGPVDLQPEDEVLLRVERCREALRWIARLMNVGLLLGIVGPDVSQVNVDGAVIQLVDGGFRVVWNNCGDTVFLRDPFGNLVDAEPYEP